MVTEALVGAGLVLFGWVAKDASPARGWVMAVHLTNTFLLLAALALTAEWSARPGGVTLSGRGTLAAILGAALGTVLLAGVTGAIAALGDTLYPATTFAAGFRDELSANASVLLRLRILHPFAAIGAGAMLLVVARAALRARPGERVALGRERRRRARRDRDRRRGAERPPPRARVAAARPPLLADLLWLALVLLAAATLAPGEEAAPGRGRRSPSTA